MCPTTTEGTGIRRLSEAFRDELGSLMAAWRALCGPSVMQVSSETLGMTLQFHAGLHCLCLFRNVIELHPW